MRRLKGDSIPARILNWYSPCYNRCNRLRYMTVIARNGRLVGARSEASGKCIDSQPVRLSRCFRGRESQKTR
jgi:hypothetical protein